MRRGARVAALLGLLLGAAAATAQSIAYTVQVVALSDKDSALALQAQLDGDGYPAYVVRSTTGLGDIYRVRIGAYANRQAALVFADSMPDVAGGKPIPALAEAIPPGIVSLAPRVITRIIPDGRNVGVVPWRDGVAVRLQQRTPLSEARYVVLSGDQVDSFDAWLAVPAPDGSITRLRNLPLWPDNYQQDSPAARDAFEASVLSLVAEGLGLPLSDVKATIYQPDASGVPRLIVLERVMPSDKGTETSKLLALGVPELGMTPNGPVQYLGLHKGAVPAAPDPTPLKLDAPPPGTLQGDGWTAQADGNFIAITDKDGKRWREAAGTPLWTDGHVLVSAYRDSFLFYDFLPR
ncbi:MAG TPA: SPOR domain-containing protein [Trueperaceae bacterium]|nr:SPOR domain-containing protein [Trueperaceae bacterium]